MRFDELKLKPELLEQARKMGFEEPTPIQEKAVPQILRGKDVVGQAETGSGKTVAFALPILDKLRSGNGVQVLVLTPTRELCVQVTDVFSDFGKPLGIKAMSVYGGVGIEPQIRNLQTADVVVGTPGRILDHLGRGTADFSRLRFLVLDETDKMFEMGFVEDVEKIISQTPNTRQSLMFSATVSWDIQELMKKHLKDPIMMETQSYVDTRKLNQVYYDIYNQNEKFSLLVHLLRRETPGLAIVFCATRHESDIVATNLKRQGVNAMAIHGGMTQHMREKSLDALKHESIDVLVATDVAARGLDIKNVSHVYNYDVPKTPKEYIHRIGRTARAGEAGEAVTLLTNRDHDNFRRVLQDEGIDVERWELPNFRRVPFSRAVHSSRDGRRPYPTRRDSRSRFSGHRGSSDRPHSNRHRDSRGNHRTRSGSSSYHSRSARNSR